MKTCERHLFVEAFRGKYTVKEMCKVLKISESGYYRWLKNRSKPTSRQLLSVEIQKILDEHPDNDNYGAPRVRIALEQREITVSERTVSRAMSEMGISHQKRVPHGITKATTEVQEQENLIKRDFSANKPLKKVVSDITEIQCYDGKLYVSAVPDCFNGEIVALAMDDNMRKELCIRTVEQLRSQYGKRLAGMIFHSDRGSQYTSLAFREALAAGGMVQSLSGTGHCFDNARMESFWATLKKEKIYRIAAYRLTRKQVKTIVFRYIFVYYNRIRIYTANPMGLPPVKYREWAATQSQTA